MPELPEVETTARGLRPRLVGRRIIVVDGVDWPRMLPNITPADLSAALLDREVFAVERRGKYLMLQFTNCSSLLLHRKMSGNLVLRPPGNLPARHTHLILGFDGGLELHFVDPRKFGRIYFFPSPEAYADFIAARLGPEPLDDLSPAHLGALLAGRRGRLKSLLLDQRFLAGLGNLYADEALWQARLHPERAADSLTRSEIGRLSVAIREVLEGAIARRGTSLSDYVDAAGEPGENQDFLLAYGRAGLPCQRCARPIVRRLVGQRGTWFCPHCQKAPLRAL
jgi:formamidopyrimidine-DNA glycosylase